MAECPLRTNTQMPLATRKETTDLLVQYLELALKGLYIYFHYILLGVVSFIVIYILYKAYWSPVVYKKGLPDVGYRHVTGPGRTLHIARVLQSRRVGKSLPPPYPNGWYALIESRDLRRGAVAPVDALGLNLCVYRGEDGVARVVDAYCPHLGANIGVGGTVSGNCVRCPFHQWTFGEDGVCTSIPGVDKVPNGISIKSWPCMEVDGAVWVWYDAEGRAPLWTVSALQETSSWGCRGRNEFIVNAHIQEIPENGADVAHLNAVHTSSAISNLGIRYPFLNHLIGHHVWSAEWERSEESHLASSSIRHSYLLFKRDVLPFEATAHQIGPAHVRLFFRTPLGPILITQSITPLGPLLQRVVTRVFTPARNALAGFLLVYGEAFQFSRDVAIWNNKQYNHSPLYVRSDKNIRAFRSWFAQFYSDHSTSYRDATQPPLDW